MSKEKKLEKQQKKRRNSAARAVTGLIGAVIVYILIPMAIMTYILPEITQIDTAGLSNLFERWIVAGIPLVALAAPRKYFGKGGVKCLVFSLAYGIMKIVWIIYVLNFGDLSGFTTLTSGDDTMRIDIALTGLMYLLVLLRTIKLLYIYADYRDNRKEYLEEHGDNGDDVPQDPIRVKGRFD